MNRANEPYNPSHPRDPIRRLLQGARILLVEDSYDSQRLVARILQLAGAEVDLECNGQAALTTLERRPDAYDAIVADFVMPIVDGIEMTRRLRAAGLTPAVIGVSGVIDDRMRAKWLESGCDVVLAKPLDATGLIESVASAIARVSPRLETSGARLGS